MQQPQTATPAPTPTPPSLTPTKPASMSWFPGLVLIVIGLAIGAIVWFGVGGEIVVLGIGLVFLAAYAINRSYGFLVPGGIMTGLGAGIAAQSTLPEVLSGAIVVLGLGAGFLAVWAIDQLVTHARGRWWPLIPGLGLVAIGAMIAAGAYSALDVVGAYAVPILLVLVGVWLLVRPRRSVR